MKIYTLFYKDTGLYNRSIFVMPNHAAAKKAMKLNLMDSRGEGLRNEAKLGNTELVSLITFDETLGIQSEKGYTGHEEIICNLKDLLDDNNGNSESVQRDNS